MRKENEGAARSSCPLIGGVMKFLSGRFAIHVVVSMIRTSTVVEDLGMCNSGGEDIMSR